MHLLEGVRVLDVSRLIPGALATMILADMGADVIKVEDPRGSGDYFRLGGEPERGGMRLQFAILNRNKRSACINFRTAEGLELVYELARTSQVFVESARPGASTKLGLGYEQIKAANPAIVYCSLTGFGQTGPFAHLATHGGAYHAVTGTPAPYQLKDGTYVQYRPMPSIGSTAGAWLSTSAILGGLFKSQRTGSGCCLDMSCADAAVMSLDRNLEPVLNGTSTGWRDPEEDVSVKYCYYKTSDGRFMLLQAIEQHFWQHFCEVVGRPDLAARGDWSDSRMDSAVNDLELRDELVKLFATKTQDEWTRIFIDHNIAGAPYYALGEVAESDLFRSREMFVEEDHPVAGHIKMAADAIKVQGDPFEITRHAPRLGENTDEVLSELGRDAEAIKALRGRGVAR
jgi:crotonobetainyl-CoA:carnitine CoA-transferase CaiB-like acyl-CoA transferase